MTHTRNTIFRAPAQASETMLALVTMSDGSAVLKNINIPVPMCGEILVKVIAACQNPTDWKTFMLFKKQGNVLGCDFSGVVAAIGPGTPSGTRKLGERVAGFVHGGISTNGSYAEYVVAQAELVIPIPDTWSFEEAAQLGIACHTTCLALYLYLHIPPIFIPDISPVYILIWGGATSTGQYAIQFAKLAGLRVITTSSPPNFQLLKDLGADEVFDYADSYTPRKIFTHTGGTLRHAIDCISEGMTPAQVSMCLSKDCGKIATLLPCQGRKSGVDYAFVLAYVIFGKDIEIPFKTPANEEAYHAAVDNCKWIGTALKNHYIKPNRVKSYPNGIASVLDGFEDMKMGKVHAEKITYRISDTPAL